VIGSTTINFQEFETGASGSTVTVQDIGTFTFRTPLATDLLTLDSVTAGRAALADVRQHHHRPDDLLQRRQPCRGHGNE